jgi:hypothetical protein
MRTALGIGIASLGALVLFAAAVVAQWQGGPARKGLLVGAYIVALLLIVGNTLVFLDQFGVMLAVAVVGGFAMNRVFVGLHRTTKRRYPKQYGAV